jgi:predicted AlkP superfamily phosphohydrolase/phosphomutase
MKILIVGFDGLSPDLYRNKLLDYVMAMTVEWNCSPASWTTIYTGKSFREHKVVHLDYNCTPFEIDGKIVNSCHFGNSETPYIWKILNHSGVSCELFNLPLTYPPRPINRYMVSGFPIPFNGDIDGDTVFTYPSSLKHYFMPLYASIYDFYGSNEPQKSLTLGQAAWFVEKSALWKVDKFIELHSVDAQFGFIQFTFLDRLSHVYGQPQAGYYIVENIVDDLYQKLEPENLIILSDHGCIENKHQDYAFFGIKGPAVRKRDQISNMDIYGIILECFGIDPALAIPPRYVLDVDEEQSQIEKRLEALGYV